LRLVEELKGFVSDAYLLSKDHIEEIKANIVEEKKRC
jgi:hypothetical protein